MPKPLSSRLPFAALLLGAAIVIARSTMSESLRDPFGVTLGSQPYPRGAGPAAALVLDLLCCVPALLVLLHRTLHPSEIGRRSWACLLAGLLGVWAIASVIWADDKFAAAVGAAHLIAAFVLLWAMAQIVTDWGRLRLVAALAHGLLLVYLTQGLLLQFVDMPQTLHDYETHKTEFLQQRGWQANSFLARQFEIKLKNQELLGFNTSTNSYAAAIVLLLGVSGGLLIQRYADGEVQWAAAIGVSLPAAIWILYYTHCKAAFVTPLLIAFILRIVWQNKRFLSVRPKTGYIVGAAVLLAAAVGIVSWGLIFHGLPGASLNFRWRYWIAAWRMFMDHPLLGVGWDNFGLHYIHYRLAAAAEEIQDPHNFLLRFFTELGLIGGLLAAAWLARLWWEFTSASFQSSALSPASSSGLGLLTFIAAAGMALNVMASVDFDESGAFIFIEVLKRMLFICVLVLGASVAAMKSLHHPLLDDRPAPWVLYAMLASLAVFLTHNLIEFSIFETGPLMIFALLAGSALGIRHPQPVPRQRRRPVAWLFAAVVVWLAAAVVLVIPTIQAESLAQQGDDALRSFKFDQASADYLAAYHDYVGFNADYLYRAALALAFKPHSNRAAPRRLLDEAISADPSAFVYYLSRARVEEEIPDPQAAGADFSKALKLNPNEVTVRLEYAEMLAHFGRRSEAAAQYQSALKYNDLLPPDEPKRLTEDDIRRQWPPP